MKSIKKVIKTYASKRAIIYTLTLSALFLLIGFIAGRFMRTFDGWSLKWLQFTVSAFASLGTVITVFLLVMDKIKERSETPRIREGMEECRNTILWNCEELTNHIEKFKKDEVEDIINETERQLATLKLLSSTLFGVGVYEAFESTTRCINNARKNLPKEMADVSSNFACLQMYVRDMNIGSKH